MVQALVVYYLGVVLALLLQVTLWPKEELGFRDASKMILKSIGSWITIIYIIVKRTEF